MTHQSYKKYLISLLQLFEKQLAYVNMPPLGFATTGGAACRGAVWKAAGRLLGVPVRCDPLPLPDGAGEADILWLLSNKPIMLKWVGSEQSRNQGPCIAVAQHNPWIM